MKTKEVQYNWKGQWIWCKDAPTRGQWALFRRTFTVKNKPHLAEARISADSKYWMWINGKMAVFEGMVKNGPNPKDMYYDIIDLAPYLLEGNNTIAIQAVYFGTNGYGFKDSGLPGLLFDAEFEEGVLESGTRLVSNRDWKTRLDPAYEKHETDPNYRLAEPNVKYDASQELNGWQTSEYNDSSWDSASVKADFGESKRNIDLIRRPIPQLKVEEINLYTKDGDSVWKEEITGNYIETLKLPDEYLVSVEFQMEHPGFFFGQDYDLPSCFAILAGATDGGNYSMIRLAACREIGVGKTRPEIELITCQKGLETIHSTVNIAETFPKLTLYDHPHTMSILIEKDGFTGSLDDITFPKQKCSGFFGGTVGFSNVSGGMVKIYRLQVTDKISNTILYDAKIKDATVGSVLKTFQKLLPGVDTSIQEKDDEKYLYINSGLSLAGNENPDIHMKKYTIRNRTNLQGTPYLKVDAPAGRRIEMYTDTYHDVNGDSIRHSYITRQGIQEYEGRIWFNGYDVFFEIPSDVHVLELGFRPSIYNTKETGIFTCEDEFLNRLYRKCYDTLLVTMRDTFMDCPDRERTQWIGDAVNEMQMASYSMDENAMLLFRKALHQVTGWASREGILPVTTPDGITYQTDAQIQEMPAQLLSCVNSLWTYYLYTGDRETLEDCYDAMLKYMNLWKLEENGLVTNRCGNPVWSDWGTNADDFLIHQCWYYKAAESLLKAAELLGKPQEDIETLKEKISSIASVFDTIFWDKEKQAYYYKTANGEPDDRANALAVYARLAGNEKFEAIKAVIANTRNASPYMEMYVQDALYTMGYECLAMDRMKSRYQDMVENYYPTLWEFWNDHDGTRNHAWTGAPLVMMYRYNAGIRPLEAGYRKCRIKPQMAGLNQIHAETDTPAGRITVSLKRKEGHDLTMRIQIPENSIAEIWVPADLNSVIHINHKLMFADENRIKKLEGVSYIGRRDNFIIFEADAGEWHISVSN